MPAISTWNACDAEDIGHMAALSTTSIYQLQLPFISGTYMDTMTKRTPSVTQGTATDAEPLGHIATQPLHHATHNHTTQVCSWSRLPEDQTMVSVGSEQGISSRLRR